MNDIVQLFFLNPSEHLADKLRIAIEQRGFEKREVDGREGEWKYIKGEVKVFLQEAEDTSGLFIMLLCEGITEETLIQALKTCPECGSNELKASMYYGWMDDNLVDLYKDGKIGAWPVSYNRFGTAPETKTCLKCGCKWHNEAEKRKWGRIASSGQKVTVSDL